MKKNVEFFYLIHIRNINFRNDEDNENKVKF